MYVYIYIKLVSILSSSRTVIGCEPSPMNNTIRYGKYTYGKKYFVIQIELFSSDLINRGGISITLFFSCEPFSTIFFFVGKGIQ